MTPAEIGMLDPMEIPVETEIVRNDAKHTE